jgi:hypothetical protein
MLADQYDLAVSTVSEAARDAYVQGCELALTFYPVRSRRSTAPPQTIPISPCPTLRRPRS